MAKFPTLYLARHGETAWSASGQHTGRTDLALTAHGEEQAKRLSQRLASMQFAAVLTSPLQRARRTCELAEYGQSATVDADLTEWDYGLYEGRRSDEIRAERPGWDVFRDGAPGGETPAAVVERADRIVARVRRVAGDVLLFSSAHLLRVLAARWAEGPIDLARTLVVAPASLSALSYEHALNEPVIVLWNDVSHLESTRA